MKPAGPFTSASSTRKLPIHRSGASSRFAYCSIAIVTSALTTRGPHSAGCQLGARAQWLVDSNGGVFSIGGAPFYGSASGQSLASPVVGIAPTPGGGGYWEDGVATGASSPSATHAFYGSMGGRPLIRAHRRHGDHPRRQGLLGGGVATAASISFGDAGFYGSTGSLHLNAPIVGMESTSDGKGYWLVAGDGGIFNYGDAGFFGSTGRHPSQPARGRHGDDPRRQAATGWRLATGASSPSATPCFFGATPALGPGPGLGHHGQPRTGMGYVGSGHRRSGLPPWRRRRSVRIDQWHVARPARRRCRTVSVTVSTGSITTTMQPPLDDAVDALTPDDGSDGRPPRGVYTSRTTTMHPRRHRSRRGTVR